MKDQDLERLLGLMDEVESYARNLRPASGNENTSAASLNINAGGAGAWAAAWIASICCTACLVAMVLGGMWMLHQAKQIDDLNAYLQAIYQQAPSLQPPKEASK